MATAWQQRAPGAVAINNLLAAAAVRQPTAPRCKCAALSAPAHPPARVDVPDVHRPFLIVECIPRHHLKVETTTTKTKKQTKRTRAQNLRIISGRCPRKLLGQIWSRYTQVKLGLCHRASSSPRPRRPPRLLPVGCTVLPRLSEMGSAVASQPAAPRCLWLGGGPLSPRLGLRPSFNLDCGSLPLAITPPHPLHRNFPPSNTQPINPILSSNTEFHPRTYSLSPRFRHLSHRKTA